MVQQLQLVVYDQKLIGSDRDAVPRSNGGHRTPGEAKHFFSGLQITRGDKEFLRPILLNYVRRIIEGKGRRRQRRLSANGAAKSPQAATYPLSIDTVGGAFGDEVASDGKRSSSERSRRTSTLVDGRVKPGCRRWQRLRGGDDFGHDHALLLAGNCSNAY